MEGGSITGSTTVGLYDHFRAHLTTLNVRLVAGVMAFVVVYTAFRMRLEANPISVIDAALLLVILAVLAAIMAVIVSLVQAAITTARLDKNQSGIAYRLDDRGLTMTDLNGSAVATPWITVKRAREDAVAFCFRLKPAGARYVPKRAFAPADVVAIRTLLAEKLGASARLKA